MQRERGVLIATDQHLEWLLPWWWERYSACNSLPVVFVDLGMSQEKRDWCQERGEVISLKGDILEKPLPENVYLDWKAIYGESYLQSRKAWFKKPSACLLSPFEKTIWIDLDCEILDSLDPMFSCLPEGKEIAVTFGPIDVIPKGLEKAVEAGTVCNSGVIVFSKDSLIMKHWVDRSLSESENHWGDDCLLSIILSEYTDRIAILPDIYNWRISRGLPLHAKIIHWCGEWGKNCIAKNGGLKKALEKL